MKKGEGCENLYLRIFGGNPRKYRCCRKLDGFMLKHYKCLGRDHKDCPLNQNEVANATKEPFDTDDTREIVCPHCGYKFSNSYEFGMDSDGEEQEIDCGRCEKPFIAMINISVTYSSRTIPPMQEATP